MSAPGDWKLGAAQSIRQSLVHCSHKKLFTAVLLAHACVQAWLCGATTVPSLA